MPHVLLVMPESTMLCDSSLVQADWHCQAGKAFVEQQCKEALVTTATSPCQALMLIKEGLFPTLVACGLFPDCTEEGVPGCIALLRKCTQLEPPAQFILWSCVNDLDVRYAPLAKQVELTGVRIARGWGYLQLMMSQCLTASLREHAKA